MKSISRRTLLKGMGAMLGLPLLEAMHPRTAFGASSSATPQPPVRLGVLFMPNGVNPDAWTPKGAGRDFELSEILTPLAQVRDEILVLTDLWNAGSDTGDGHYVKTAGFLTGTTITRTTGSDIRSGNVSLDQLVAQHVGNMTPLPSLELGIEPVATGVDTNVGFTRLYASHISWSTPVNPVAKEINPRLAFDRLFRSQTNQRRQSANGDKSVLDLVAQDARKLQSKVGAADRAKLDEYFESVRAVERRIEFDARRRREDTLVDPLAQKAIRELDGRITDFYNDPAQVSERRVDHTEQVRLMLDIMVLGFWTDSTRVSTFMFGNAVSGKNFSFLDGVSGGFHQISHHENDKAKLQEYLRINRWHIEQYAYLLGKLHSIQDGPGTLLDNSMILFGSGLRDGNRHNPHNLPIVLAGRAGGTLSPGRHIVYDKDTPLSNLYLAMLHRAGAPVERFADSTGELPGLNDPEFQGPGAVAG
jgi:hypothetical protein